MTHLDFKKIDKSFDRIRPYISRTPLVSNETINKIIGANVYFKLENLQITGSFKIRGAINKISKLNKTFKKKGVVAYSSGNHAQAVAYASKLFNINSTIVMPSDAPQIKIKNTKKYGAKVILYDSKISSREKIALDISKKENKTLIKPYDDIDIISGQGTIGKEIAEDLIKKNIKPDIYLCCCGGGGLIAGTSTYLKHVYPKIRNYSVEPKSLNDTELSLKKNKIVSNKKNSWSICDALFAPQPGEITFPINQLNLSGGLSISDSAVKKSIILIAENLKVVSEPGGAVATSALFSNHLKLKNKNVVVIISGGNIDYSFFSDIVNEKNE